MIFDSIPECVLAVYAHPDDAEIACGASLARWAAGGARVHLCLTTKGDKGTGPPGLGTGKLAERRLAETREAMALLGVADVESLGYGDGDLLDGPELVGRVTAVIRRVCPDVLCCPDPTAMIFGDRYVNHRDHRVTGLAALDAAAWAAPNPNYFPDAGPPHSVRSLLLSGTLEPTAHVDVTATLEDKVRAIACHRSQLGEAGDSFAAWLPERAAETGRPVGLAAAEAFRLVQLL